MAIDNQSLGATRAGGAIATSLIEVLHDKGILSLEDARTVLGLAFKRIGAVGDGAVEANQIIGTMMSGFLDRRDEP